MGTVSKIILVIAVIWPIWQMLSIRKQVLRGGIIVPPFVASTLIFAIFVLVVLIFSFSPFHLLWLFILSLILGFVLIIFPFVQRITIAFLAILVRGGWNHDTKR